MKHKWYEIKAQADGEEAEVWLYAEIGEDFWGDGSSIPARTFAAELAQIEAQRIALHINSPGGDVFDGQAIYTLLKNHPATVTTYIDGLAASIASVIALAGEHVVMAENALYMIHQPFGMTRGTAADHLKTADILDHISDAMAGVYEARSDMKHEAIVAAMDAETWYTASKALEAGFVDEISENVQAAALARFDLKALGFRHPPEPEPDEPELPAAQAPEAAEKASGDSDPTLIARTVNLLTRPHEGGQKR